ncbi:TolC family outer membrane protein [Marinobacterium sp. D7]|uniref:TolC family outer membrane protein n=1 Tax=Marinobacterium ramblicola TaxID=2849041 RepID=UPI001C2D4C9B|nr:TolC family outer membrane protein [Marinobacterium ramblicola]MBV1788602.1 TolC family outer membrane protein [Marinobacterium ramblicola]
MRNREVLRSRRWLLTTALLTALGTSQAQAGALHDLYLRALANDPQLKAAEATYNADREALPQSRAALLPQIGLSADTTRTDSRSFDGNSHGYTLALSQPVFDAGSWFNFRRGQVLDEKAQTEFALAQQSLIQRTVDIYLNVLRAQSALDLAQAQERALKRRLDQVNAQFDVGLIAITDVLDAQASYDDAAVQLIEAQGALRNSFEAVERLGGTSVEQISPLKSDYPIQSVSPNSPESWLERALQDNLDFRVSQYNQDATRRTLQAARAERLPKVTLEMQNGENTQRGDWSDSNSIALSLSVPLYTGGSLSSGISEADLRNQAALFSLEDQRRNLTEQTRSLLRDLNTSVESVKARAQSIKSRETALQATEEGFSVGTRNVVDVLDAENALYQAKLNYANARYDHVSTLFQFKQVIGSLSPEDILALDSWLEP